MVLALIEPAMSFMIASYENEVAVYLLERGGNLSIIARERVHKAQFFGIALSMAARRPVKPAIIGKDSHISRLQNQIDLFASLSLPAGAELEAEMEIAMQIGKKSNVDRKITSFYLNACLRPYHMKQL